MPVIAYLVTWKKNRNNRGREIVFSLKKASELIEQKKNLGFKTQLKKLHPRDPLLIHFTKHGVIS
jgi:hypothetical protein